jgi:3D (Asp-Asp-Asp) domain-containing protein
VKKSFYVMGTGYTATCAGCSGVTATGLDLRANPNLKVIAVDPRVIPLGSLVEMSSASYPKINGVYIAGDTGGAIKGYKVDIFIPTKSKAIEFGRRKDILVRIIREGY